MPNLVVAWAKIKRASKHLDEIAGIADHLKCGPGHSIDQQTRRGNRANTVKWRAVLKVEDEPPPRLSVLVGEVLYNLRSALDLLAYHLAAEASKPKGPPRGTGFPVHDSEEHFFLKDPKSASGYARSSGCHKTRGMDRVAREFIECNQPYKGRNKSEAHCHPLWRLHDACNADKHIAPLVAARYIEPVTDVVRSRNADVRIKDRVGPFKDEDPVATGDIFFHDLEDSDVYLEVRIATDVVFKGGPLDGLPLAVLPEIALFVFAIFEELAPEASMA